MNRDGGPLSARPEMGLLEVGVRVEIDRIRGMPDTDRIALAAGCAQHIASHGDDLLFRSRPGASADAFAKLSTGLACLAYQPGGVTFAGMHWEAAQPPEGK